VDLGRLKIRIWSIFGDNFTNITKEQKRQQEEIYKLPAIN